MKVIGQIDDLVQRKAREALKSVASGKMKPRKIKRHGFDSIKIGLRYRLINFGRGWVLMTHERYNRYS